MTTNEMSYRIMQAYSQENLEEKVNEYLNKGYVLVGSATVSHIPHRGIYWVQSIQKNIPMLYKDMHCRGGSI